MYKRMIILTYALVFFSLFATACSDNNNETYVEPILSQIEVSKLVTENNKTYVSVDGKPFPFLGAQIRLDALLNCDKMTINEVENYFKKAQELGLNCVQIPISWNMVEPKENKYDYSIVNSILQFVNKYNLKMELLWFSTNMVGDSFSYLIPQYVLQEYNKRLSRNDEGNFWNYYGYQYTMILDDEWILERETKAITALFNHIRYWDSQNGDKHPVISAQIHNEPDALMRWRIDQKDLKYRDGTPLSKEKAWTMITNALNTVGKAVKNSSYRVVTRVNLIYGDGINPFPEATNARPKDVFDLQGIVFLQRISDGNRQITRIPLFAVGRPVAHFDGLFPLFVLDRPRDPYLVPETVGAAVQVVLPIVQRQLVRFPIQGKPSLTDPVAVTADHRAAKPVGRVQVVVDRLVSPDDVLEIPFRIGHPQRYHARAVIGDLDDHAAVVSQRVERHVRAVQHRIECRNLNQRRSRPGMLPACAGKKSTERRDKQELDFFHNSYIL